MALGGAHSRKEGSVPFSSSSWPGETGVNKTCTFSSRSSPRLVGVELEEESQSWISGNKITLDHQHSEKEQDESGFSLGGLCGGGGM